MMMVHDVKAEHINVWKNIAVDSTVDIFCLLPNSLGVPLTVNADCTLHEIKEELWEVVCRMPLLDRLEDASSYVFHCVNFELAEREQLEDEGRRLLEIRPFQAVLQLTAKSTDHSNRVLHQQISHLIGRGLHEFDALKNPEVKYFRWKMKALAEEMWNVRSSKSWTERLTAQYPPRLAPPRTSLPPTVTARLQSSCIMILIVFSTNSSGTQCSHKMNVATNTYPEQLVALALVKRAKYMQSREDVLPSAHNYVLKVVGQEEYLVGKHPIVNFIYIQDALANGLEPTLVIIHKDHISLDVSGGTGHSQTESTGRNSFSTMTKHNRVKLTSSWDVDSQFTVRVGTVSRLNCDVSRPAEVVVQAGLFHGGKSLCESRTTGEQMVNPDDGTAVWDEDLQFDIKVKNIPRMARLSFVIFETSKSSKGLKSKKMKDSKQDIYINPVGWVNVSVFDFKWQLRSGGTTLYLWSHGEDSQHDDLLHPLGTVASNPDTDHSAALTITFQKYDLDKTIVYPSLEKVVDLGRARLEKHETPPISSFDYIRALDSRDPLHEMHEQEKKDVWANRFRIQREAPRLLPHILDSVDWNNNNQVCEMTALLDSWPLLAPEKALELLDYAYADHYVRAFAVKCLAELTDDDLSLYLLQLVQALKHENFLMCDLAEFLLRRALSNQKIGHFLFWHLRSEMHVASVWVRFGLVLEAYCWGDKQHMKSLSRQVALLAEVKSLSDEVRNKRDKDKARHWLHEKLTAGYMRESVQGVVNPLDPNYRFKNVRVEKCRVMDSKMRPLWLVMENHDPLGDDVYLLFKNGDDLRQDMLTLQMIRLMDRLWKNEGIDLRMNPYGCISTDNRTGVIEVVLNAETIANIQKEKGMFSATSAFKKGSLLAWLKDHNQSETSLKRAIEEFTYSCAGYCVATYVLGVADRHSDNIMVKRTGQLFHIDFGHILGHFKEKFGFRRERVPFVLTHDFVHVINKGQAFKKDRSHQPNKFEIFQKLCEEAFLVLRKHGNLILSLFAMMISTGLPELSSEQDLSYLRDTLVLDLSEVDARAHFRSKFDEALCNSWKTSLNWASHNMAKNNNK